MSKPNKDINDAVKAGVKLTDLIAAADNDDPVLGSNWARLAAEGVGIFARVVETVCTAQDAREAVRLLQTFQADDNARWSVGVALKFREHDVAPLFTRLMSPLAPKGTAGAARDLKRAIADDAKAVQARMAERGDRGSSQTLDALTRQLGITGLRMPSGWSMDPDGLRHGEDVIAHQPILISEILRDIDTGLYRVAVSWKRNGKWDVVHVDRDIILNARSIPKLIAFGAPANSNNASELVAYFDLFESVNIGAIPERKCAPRMGWTKGGGAFIYGRETFGEDDVRVSVNPTEQPIIDTVSCSGTWEGWIETAWNKHILPRPLAALSVYSALASFLLHPLERPGFVVDWSGETSVGKTTTMLAAASAVGVPAEDDAGYVHSWASAKHSNFGHMRKAYLLQSFAFVLDETKRQEDHSLISRYIYDHVSGQAQAAGQADGTLRKLLAWRSVLLTTGEAPITDYTKDGGAQARVICLQGSPWGEKTDDNAKLAKLAVADFAKNYGHMGRRFVKYLVDNKESWPLLRRRYDAMAAAYKSGGGVNSRLSDSLAVIELAAWLAHEKLGLPGKADGAMAVARACCAERVQTIDKPLEALNATMRWAWANEAKFWRREPGGRNEEPAQGWYGRWDKGEFWRFVAFNDELLKRQLELMGFPSSDILNAWKSRGWLYTDASCPSPGSRPKVGYGGVRMIALKRDAAGVE